MPPIAFYLSSSLIEWPGKIVACVVLQGCNFRCPYCHSSEFVAPGTPASEVPLPDVLANLETRRDWLDAVVVSGGEPTIHADLPELLAAFKGLGMLVKLDTNGSNPQMLRRLMTDGLVDLVALDIKAPLDERYFKAAERQVDLEAVRESVELLAGQPQQAEFRTTVVPGLIEAAEVAEIARLIPNVQVYYLQNFQPRNTLDPAMMQVRPFDEPTLRAFAAAAARHTGCVVVRGTEIAEGNGCSRLRETGML